MYNNHITYDEKWNTKENNKALKTLQDKYFDRSECSPDCPVAWAPEVLELLDLLDKELGITYNTSTMRGYYIRGNMFRWFMIQPWTNALYSFKKEFFYPSAYREKDPILKRPLNVLKEFFHPIKYGLKSLKMQLINPLLNKLFKPKLYLSQIKEKYGSLTMYVSSSDVHEEWVEKEIRRTELKLAIKGAYYPVESFWDAAISYSVGNNYHPDIITTKEETFNNETSINVKRTTFRNLMKEMNLDLKDIEQKSIIRQSQNKDLP